MTIFRRLLISFTAYRSITKIIKQPQHLGCLKFIVAGFVTYKFYQISQTHHRCWAAVPINNDSQQRFNFVANVVEMSSPAVVYIEVKDTRRIEFFTGKAQTISNGSGFIIAADGLILTNAHVVTNKPHSITVEVKLMDGTTYTGVVEDIDWQSDLATVRIKTNKTLPTLKLGSSANLRPGEFVVAMGSPLALSNTVTFGVISSTHRESTELGLYGKDMTYLQTDAAITFGNSGGPLVNMSGEAIGINSMKVTPGISFAIPSDYVKKFLATTRAKDYKQSATRRRYMGITMLSLTPQLLVELQQRSHDIPQDIQYGVLVWKVIMGSPAHIGGVQPGDIVTHIDGKQITAANDVYTALTNAASKTVTVRVQRGHKVLQLLITPEDLDSV